MSTPTMRFHRACTSGQSKDLQRSVTDRPQRVLIVRPSALGDVSRTVPVLVTLRRSMPHAHIDWLVHEAFADTVRYHPDLDGVVAFPRKRFSTAWCRPQIAAEAMAWCTNNLRAARYDLAFDFQGLFRSGFFTWLTSAPRRVGFANAREMAWLGYSRRHRIDPRGHTVDRMLALAEAEGFESLPDMRLYLGADDRRWLDAWLLEHGGSGPYACIAPTARWRCKCWPIEKYAQIARRLLDTGLAGHRLIILAAPGERQQARSLLDALGNNPHVLAPQTTVGQMMAVLSRTRVLIANDSAPLHVAVGFDRPVVAIFGPTDPALVGPYRRSESVVRPKGVSGGDVHYRRYRDDQSLIAQVTVEAVWEKIVHQIGESDPSASRDPSSADLEP